MADEYGDDRIYKWTIRTLYAFAIGLNCWILWDQVKDSPEALAIRSKLSEGWEKASAPVREAKMFERARNRMIYEATTIVEQEGDDADGH